MTDLNAVASSPAERLKNVSARVGLPANSRSDAYFTIADPISNILLAIENTTVESSGVQQLYNGVFMNDMLAIITQWSTATGRDIKELVNVRGGVAPVGASARTATAMAPVSGNGGIRRGGVSV